MNKSKKKKRTVFDQINDEAAKMAMTNLAPEKEPAPPAVIEQSIVISRRGDTVGITCNGLTSQQDIYGLLRIAELQVPSIKWEEAKS